MRLFRPARPLFRPVKRLFRSLRRRRNRPTPKGFVGLTGVNAGDNRWNRRRGLRRRRAGFVDEDGVDGVSAAGLAQLLTDFALS